MIYNTIPIPQINFADEPEKEGQGIFELYFASDFNISYMIDNAKNFIRSKLYNQDSQSDRIVILSYLINRLTDKIYNLTIPRNSFESGIQDRETKPTYRTMLHFLYRLIENEGIEIPTDLFSKEEIEKANQLIIETISYIETQKAVFPEKDQEFNDTQCKLEKTRKFFWLGKEKWSELLIAAILPFAIDKGLAPHFATLIELIKSFFKTVLKLN